MCLPVWVMPRWQLFILDTELYCTRLPWRMPLEKELSLRLVLSQLNN